VRGLPAHPAYPRERSDPTSVIGPYILTRSATDTLPIPCGLSLFVMAHMCSQMRGVHDVVSQMRTIVWRGTYQQDERLQRAFLALAGQRDAG